MLFLLTYGLLSWIIKVLSPSIFLAIFFYPLLLARTGILFLSPVRNKPVQNRCQSCICNRWKANSSLPCHMEKQTAPMQRLDPHCFSNREHKFSQARTGQRLPQHRERQEELWQWGQPEPRAYAGTQEHSRPYQKWLEVPCLLPTQPRALTARNTTTVGLTMTASQHSAFHWITE